MDQGTRSWRCTSARSASSPANGSTISSSAPRGRVTAHFPSSQIVASYALGQSRDAELWTTGADKRPADDDEHRCRGCWHGVHHSKAAPAGGARYIIDTCVFGNDHQHHSYLQFAPFWHLHSICALAHWLGVGQHRGRSTPMRPPRSLGSSRPSSLAPLSPPRWPRHSFDMICAWYTPALAFTKCI